MSKFNPLALEKKLKEVCDLYTSNNCSDCPLFIKDLQCFNNDKFILKKYVEKLFHLCDLSLKIKTELKLIKVIKEILIIEASKD